MSKNLALRFNADGTLARKTLTLKPEKKGQTARVVHLLPWENKVLPRPWPNGYSRVVVPFTARERAGSDGTKAHVAIVRNSRLEVV